MLQLVQNDSDGRLIVTLNELVTLPAPYFYFEFTHAETRQVVAVPVDPATDESQWPSRFNQFPIDVPFYFNGYPAGEWLYRVYERSNLDSPVGQNLIESGKMSLESAQAFIYPGYSPETSYQAYNG
jgi:hypothetical protein